jgi:hypothetical protein
MNSSELPDPAVSRDSIIRLRDEAAAAGDTEMIAICDRALSGPRLTGAQIQDAWAECERVIADAAAMGA